MYQRHLKPYILKYSKEYPLLALVGPRQSGKTTLVKELFPSYTYLSLENIDTRTFALEDPKGFLKQYHTHVILDEVQRAPELFSYLQGIVDDDPIPARYVLTGSSQFLLMESISQSLAGRIVTFKLFPLSFLELYRYPPEKHSEGIFKKHSKRSTISQEELYSLLFQGFYPRIHEKKINSYKWHENYIETYVERDVRQLLNIRNLRTFESFLKLVASHSGQLVNYTTLSSSLGVSLPTIKEWISILETSGLIFILPPFFENFSKRIVKTPKLYLADTGLLCYLLGVRSTNHLKAHPLLGSIFETFIITECFKRFYNMGQKPPLYFWRDQSGNEIDLLIHEGTCAFPIEIKLSQTFRTDFANGIKKWMALDDNPAKSGEVIYCGNEALGIKSPITTLPWFQI